MRKGKELENLTNQELVFMYHIMLFESFLPFFERFNSSRRTSMKSFLLVPVSSLNKVYVAVTGELELDLQR